MPGAPETIKDFLLAVLDCCLAKGAEKNVPSFVADELASRADLDLEAVARAKLQQRIAHNIKGLSLGGPDPSEVENRRHAAEDLGKIGPAAKAAVPALQKALGDLSDFVREAAAEALGKIGPDARDTVGDLIGRLKDENETEFVQEKAAIALGGIGAEAKAAVTALIEAIGDKSLDRFRYASEGDTSPDIRRAAVAALGRIGAESQQAVDALTEALKDDSLSEATADALGRFGAKAMSAVAQLRKLVEDEKINEQARFYAAISLGKIGTPDALPILKGALRNGPVLLRRAAAIGLGSMGKEAHDAVANLIDALNDDDPEVCQAAIRALGSIGAQADAALQPLMEALKEKDKGGDAAQAIGKINQREAVRVFIEALKDKDEGLQQVAAEGLGNIGSEAKDAVSALIAVAAAGSGTGLAGEEIDVCRAAIQALGSIGPEAHEAVPDLIKILEHGDVIVWADAATALGHIGHGAKDAVPALIEKLKASERVALEFVNRSRREARVASARALGLIGAQDQDVVAALREARRDPDEELQEAAEGALRKIHGKRGRAG